jgi:dihydropteroate synthase
MGILNLTPDSFSDGGRFRDAQQAVAAGVELERAGAALIDVGAVSTRPGAADVAPDEEWRRLEPVLGPLRAAVHVPISLDTTRAATAARALEVGIDLVNDVSALGDDPELAGLVAESGLPVVLMHRRGTPRTMQLAPCYDDAPAEVRAELLQAVARARAAGIGDERILLDPGIGFGKRVEDNVALLAELPALVALGFRTVLGCSRKAFLGALASGAPAGAAPVGAREAATTATTVLAALAGVDFLRVHDVKAAAEALAVVRAVRGG